MKRYLVFAFPLLLGACAQFQPGGYEFCKGTPYACNNDESAAKSAPGGNPAPAAAKPADPPKTEPKPETPPGGGKPGGGKPGDKPGHGYGDKNHDHRGPRDGNPNDREQQGHSETGKRDSDQR